MRLSYIDATGCFYYGHELEKELEYRKPVSAMFVVQFAQGCYSFMLVIWVRIVFIMLSAIILAYVIAITRIALVLGCTTLYVKVRI